MVLMLETGRGKISGNGGQLLCMVLLHMVRLVIQRLMLVLLPTFTHEEHA